jgi:hypothetical protein
MEFYTMISKNIFRQAYLRSLGLICEDVEEPVEQQEQETPVVKQVCFKTSDEALLDALQKEFTEIVIKVANEDGEEEEIAFTPDSFAEVEINEIEPEEEDEQQEDGESEDDDSEIDEIEECGGADNNMFEEGDGDGDGMFEEMFEEQFEDDKVEEPSSTDVQ